MNERDLFIAALDITDPDERNTYLDEACGATPALRKRVEHLLHTHAIAGDFLQRSVLEQLAPDSLQARHGIGRLFAASLAMSTPSR
jgi:hypothetical protein